MNYSGRCEAEDLFQILSLASSSGPLEDPLRLLATRPLSDSPRRAAVALHAATSIEVVRHDVSLTLLVGSVELLGHVDVARNELDGVGVVHVDNYIVHNKRCTTRRL